MISAKLVDVIVSRAKSAATKADIETLAAEENALALRFYKHVFPVEERAWADVAPEGWLRLDRCLRFQLGYRTIELRLEEAVPVPSREYGCQRLGIIKDEGMIAAFEAFAAAKQNVEKKKEEVAQAVKALLLAARSLKHLQEIWPEGEPFFADLLPVKSNLPVVTTEKVNSLLNLTAAPVIEGAAA